MKKLAALFVAFAFFAAFSLVGCGPSEAPKPPAPAPEKAAPAPAPEKAAPAPEKPAAPAPEPAKK